MSDHETLTEELISEMKAAMLAAYEQALAKLLASPVNELSPEATREEMPFTFVQAAFDVAVALKGVADAQHSFGLVATPADEPLHLTFNPPGYGSPSSSRAERRAAKRQMQKASRKANRR